MLKTVNAQTSLEFGIKTVRFSTVTKKVRFFVYFLNRLSKRLFCVSTIFSLSSGHYYVLTIIFLPCKVHYAY